MARMKKLKPPKIDLKEKKQEKIARKLEASRRKSEKGRDNILHFNFYYERWRPLWR